MALLLPHHLHCSHRIDKHRKVLHFASPAKLKPIRKHEFVRATSKSAINDDPSAAAAGETAPDAADSKKPISSGQGFGQPAPAKPDPGPATTNKKKQKAGRRERGSVIRRTPVERPAFLDKKDGEVGKQQAQNESAFLLTWLGLGSLILIEGIVLAASGFLPEQWDSFLVKYLYPSFTPTVALFVAGTVVYGVLKYLQNENAKISK